MSSGTSCRCHQEPRDRHWSLADPIEKSPSAARKCALGQRSSQNPVLGPGIGWVTWDRPVSLSEFQLVICTRVCLAVLTPPLFAGSGHKLVCEPA